MYMEFFQNVVDDSLTSLPVWFNTQLKLKKVRSAM